ncbi:cellulose biosynthesis cyclic di-GMP-binding regulatory protein BcsB [Radiobacillus sp. PE A8.2]|uniref:cellulose biosynthesis cyclic di-GMP-binding regulatory protein BcsB n=1 Tax=Radiobacillus sp. PE A8.2 TaxID=3380349 RepID=UPI00388D08D8
MSNEIKNNNYRPEDDFISLSRQNAHEKEKKEETKKRRRLGKYLLLLVFAGFIYLIFLFGSPVLNYVKDGFANYESLPFFGDDDDGYVLPQPVTNTEDLPYPEDSPRPADPVAAEEGEETPESEPTEGDGTSDEGEGTLDPDGATDPEPTDEENTPDAGDASTEEPNNPNYELEVVSTPGDEDSQPNNNGEIILFGEEDTTLKGVYGNRDFYFTLPLSSIGSESYVELTLSSSELLLPELSTFTVLVNDKPLESISFDEVFEYKTLKIPLDKSFLKEGVNKISIAAQTYINDNMCFDQTDAANWVVVHKSSYAFIDTNEAVITDDLLKNFPYPFITSGAQDEINTSIVIPNDSSGDVIKTAVNISQYLSQQTTGKAVVPVLFESEWSESSEQQHVIAVGEIDAWTGAIGNKITFKDQNLQDNELYLHNTIEQTEAKERQILFVTANNEQTLVEKGTFLTNPEMRQQLTGNSIKIGSMPTMTSTSADPEMNLQLVDQALVLDDTRLTSQTFYLDIPSYWTIQDKGTLELKFRASPLLNEWQDEDLQDQLGLTAYVNGTPYTVPLASLLEDDMQEDDIFSYSFQIPRELIAGQSLVPVSFEFNYPHTQEGCRRNYKSGNWVTIEQDSALAIPHEIAGGFTFTNWPAALMNESSGNYENVAFVLPENVESKGLNQLSLLVNNLASYRDFTNYKVVRGDTSELEGNTLREYHFIFLKGPDDGFEQASDDLLIPWDQNSGLNLAEFGFIEETANYVSWMQPSYYNGDKAMVYFQSLDEEKDYPYVHDKFFSLLGELDRSKDSTIIVVNKANQAYTFGEKQASGATPVTGGIAAGEEESSNILLYVSIFAVIFLLSILSFFVIWRRRRRES